MRRSRRRMSLWWQQYPSNRTRRPVAAVSAMGHERTTATPHRWRSSSARRRNPTHYVQENAVLYFKRSRAVVLIVSRGNHNNEIELGDDANRLPAPAERANPVDFTPIEPGATEPPQVSIQLIVGALELRCRR